MRKFIFLLSISILISSIADAQLFVKRFRIGAKVGLPNVLGPEAEVVLPGLGNRLAPFAGFSYFTPTLKSNQQNFLFWEAGLNVYPLGGGKLVYAGFSLSQFNLDGNYSGAQTINGETFEGFANGKLSFSTFNTKVGVRFGGLFYTKIEVGYGFGNIPQKITLTGEAINKNTNERYVGTGEVDIPNIPLIGPKGMFLANIGFGLAF